MRLFVFINLKSVTNFFDLQNKEDNVLFADKREIEII